jgi:hypothetical protein
MNTTNKSSVINADENKVVLYTDKHGDVELRADTRNDTLWATQEQIARVFDTTIPNINIHLKNIYKDGEMVGSTSLNSIISMPSSPSVTGSIPGERLGSASGLPEFCGSTSSMVLP